MPVSRRSALAMCEDEKTSMIVAVADFPWVADTRPGHHFRVGFWGGHLIVNVTGCCRHDKVADIPDCGHEVAAIRADGNWRTVLMDALMRGGKTTDPVAIDRRAAAGWVVVDFKTVAKPSRWQEQLAPGSG